jgi:hypothetical protein
MYGYRLRKGKAVPLGMRYDDSGHYMGGKDRPVVPHVYNNHGYSVEESMNDEGLDRQGESQSDCERS